MGCFSKLEFESEMTSYINSWKSKELIFSYSCKVVAAPAKTVIQLKQKETDFYTEMVVEEDAECLRLLSFNFKKDDKLESISEALYDASLIEMVLQAFDLIYFYATYVEKSGVSLLLQREEADYLTSFNYVFSKISVVNTALGNLSLLMMHTTRYNHEEFLNTTNYIKLQLRQKIWMSQKSDMFLREYLQLSCKKKKDLLKNILQPREGKQLFSGTVTYHSFK